MPCMLERAGFRDPVNRERERFLRFLPPPPPPPHDGDDDGKNSTQSSSSFFDDHLFVSDANQRRAQRQQQPPLSEVQKRYLVLCDIFGLKPNTMLLSPKHPFAQVASLSKLSQISLRGNYVSDRGLLPLLEMVRRRAVVGAVVDRSSSDDMTSSSASFPAPNLELLDFHSNGITDEGAEFVAEWLVHNILVLQKRKKLQEHHNHHEYRACEHFSNVVDQKLQRQQQQQLESFSSFSGSVKKKSPNKQEENSNSSASSMFYLTVDLSDNRDIGTGGALALIRALEKIQRACKREKWWKKYSLLAEDGSVCGGGAMSSMRLLARAGKSSANLMVSPSCHQLLSNELSEGRPPGGGTKAPPPASQQQQPRLQKLMSMMQQQGGGGGGASKKTSGKEDWQKTDEERAQERLLTTYGQTKSLFAFDDGGFFTLKREESFIPIRNAKTSFCINKKSSSQQQLLLSEAAAATGSFAGAAAAAASSPPSRPIAPAPAVSFSKSSPLAAKQSLKAPPSAISHTQSFSFGTYVEESGIEDNEESSLGCFSPITATVTGSPTIVVSGSGDFPQQQQQRGNGGGAAGKMGNRNDDDDAEELEEQDDPRLCFLRIDVHGTSIPPGLCRRILELGLI